MLIRSQLFAQSLNKPSLPVARISRPGFGVRTQGLSVGSSLRWGSFGPQKWPDWQPAPPKQLLTKAGIYSKRKTPDPWGDSGVLHAVWGANPEFQSWECCHGVRGAEAKTLPLLGTKKLQHRSQKSQGHPGERRQPGPVSQCPRSACVTERFDAGVRPDLTSPSNPRPNGAPRCHGVPTAPHTHPADAS